MSVSSLFDLSGKVAIVTGAGSGLGRAFAEAMAEAGADVVCADVNEQTAKLTAGRVRELGRRAMAIQVDVSNADRVKAMVDEAIALFDGVDILFNNAGISGGNVPAHEVPLETWHRIIDVNLNGVFYCAREAARAMLARGGGKIINTASVHGLVGSRLFPTPSYAATKGAVVSLTRELALEYAAHNINVNAIAPGYFRTNLSPKIALPEFRQAISEHVPLKRMGEPDEIKGIAVFLASTASNYVTGQIVAVDGGWSAW
ncbi:MAG: glucose 1-dehydrogenase [Chloroflexi bacterium]|nr:glucose 1-dehydrogenase [Chloroflexota bacterium]